MSRPGTAAATLGAASSTAPRSRLLGRALVLTARLGVLLVRAAMTRGVTRLWRGRTAAATAAASGVVSGLEGLGPTWVKLGQMVVSRGDLFSEPVLQALSALHDRVAVMTAAERDLQWRTAVAENPLLGEVELDERPIGSGSIACVYRGRHRGRAVAVKLQRPGVGESMALDLAILVRAAELAERLPGSGSARIADLVQFMAAALLDQIDFRREVEHTLALRRNLRSHLDVVIPQIHPELCSGTVIVMDLLDGLDIESRRSLPQPALDNAAAAALAAVGSMVFEDGFVHCDLHPGNLYVRQDGSVVILDCGYSVQVPEEVRRQLADFFAALGRGDGRRCGEIMFDSTLRDGAAHDRAAFVDRVDELVRRSQESRFEMGEFGQAVSRIQSDHGVHPPSEFAFPMMSLMVVEGTLRRLSAECEMASAGSAPRPDSGRGHRRDGFS